MKELNRCTSATRKRADNMKALIENLRAVGTMGRDEFGLFLGFSPSGGRKYLRDDVEHKPRSARFKIPAHEPVLAAFYGFSGVAT